MGLAVLQKLLFLWNSESYENEVKLKSAKPGNYSFLFFILEEDKQANEKNKDGDPVGNPRFLVDGAAVAQYNKSGPEIGI